MINIPGFSPILHEACFLDLKVRSPEWHLVLYKLIGSVAQVLKAHISRKAPSSTCGQRLDSVPGTPRMKVLTARRWHCSDTVISWRVGGKIFLVRPLFTPAEPTIWLSDHFGRHREPLGTENRELKRSTVQMVRRAWQWPLCSSFFFSSAAPKIKVIIQESINGRIILSQVNEI